MKKYKLLPILGASLLVLTACNSSGGDEITAARAGTYYSEAVASEYSFDTAHSSSSESYSGVDETTALQLKSQFSSVFSYFVDFEEGHYGTPQENFLDEYKVETYRTLAGAFGETMEYRLEGKEISASFTGSTHAQNYGFAMYFTVRYHSYGLLKSSTYSFAIAQDSDADGKADVNALFTGTLNFVWEHY